MNSPTPDKAEHYIRWKAWNESNFGRYNAKDEAAFKREFRRARIELTMNSSVLEIGFGNGAFAGWVTNYTKSYVGVEANADLLSRARTMGLEAYAATSDIDTILPHNRYFDVVVAFDVIEHLQLDEILEFLTSIRRHLAQRGKVIIRVPSGDSPFSGPYFFGDITHKTKLGSLALQQIAELTGFQIDSIKNAVFPIFGFGIYQIPIRLMVIMFRVLIEWSIRLAYFANKNVALSPNLVAVLSVHSPPTDVG